VTEILARPLINVHFPELAGVVQPLAGEYAGRRALLEHLPFVSGYGVEIAMLVDVLHEVGLDGLAQVDLGRRVHRNSPDDALCRMAGQVYLALLSRLELHGRALPTVDPSTDLTQFARDRGGFVPLVSCVGVDERPPASTLQQYRPRSDRVPSA
jgi:glucosyl-3-phosphoglycerate synthase